MDEEDQIQGQICKLDAHIIVNGRAPLHRAFSLFHFNPKGQLLLQNRSSLKVTFPNLWTNSCCSHPLYQMDEMDGYLEQGFLSKIYLHYWFGVGKFIFGLAVEGQKSEILIF